MENRETKKAIFDDMKTLMTKWLLAVRAAFLSVCLVTSLAGGSVILVSGVVASDANAAVVSSISVRGNQRVDAETVRSYLTIEPGKRFSSFDTDESLQALFATGLFSDVNISQSGRILIVTVVENPTVNLVLFEGNERVKDHVLKNVTQLKSLSVFDADKLATDEDRVREVLRRSGRSAATVTSRVDQLENNRVNVVFVINEGGRTKIGNIEFIGNSAFGDRRLMEVISHNESNFLSWLKRDDIFDPDRLRADEERLRQFYYNRGYADFQVISSNAELDEAENEYTVTITVDEGERYSFGTIEVDNALSVVTAEELKAELKIASGDTYSARNVEKSLVAISEYIAEGGYAFAEVTPRGERDFDNRLINITFFVDEGPRVYIERIEIRGNTRTRGYVIRREFDVAEGDAYNKVMINKAKRRLDGLGFFERVAITTRPGSAPDRIVVIVNVVDKATGEFSIGGGYSSANGPIGEISLTEKNFLGRGQFLKVTGGFGTDTEKYALSFTEPYFLGQRIAVGFDLAHETTDASNGIRYDNTVSSGKLRATVGLSDYLYLTGNYTFKREDLTVPSGTTLASLSLATQDSINRSPYITSSLGYSLVYDTRDNAKLPREGVRATLTQDFAGVGGDANYVRTVGSLTGYYLAAEDADIVLVGNVSGGNVSNFSGTLRVADNFFKGGETIRGFDTNGFGPRDPATGEPLGGENFAVATAEVQFPLPLLPRSFGLRGAVFSDVGTLFGNDFVADDGAKLRASVGASVIWDSPFGPLRADFAHVLDKEASDDTQAFRFGVSTRF